MQMWSQFTTPTAQQPARSAFRAARLAPKMTPTGPSARSASTRALASRSSTTRGRARGLIIPDWMRRIMVGSRMRPWVP
ncbi:MAG: hypothetical protein A3I72_14015 [Candidatus Tectomicrobia bacterium RIFCSPLOWO2_02_FULL_70_19]|nr:MAG: hypothetical protein A3I72_14015 [Candidatus Tectomicrobia bacterium RIFCSPLOWO2_02_FULL_70_19]